MAAAASSTTTTSTTTTLLSSSSSSSSSSTAQTIGNNTFTGLGNLIKLLPTGTVFLFQFLNPVLTGNGTCTALNKALTGALLSLCGLSCCFSCFTDSYVGGDGKVYYGVVTKTGLWPFWDPNYSSSTDFSKYKLRLGDFAHALLAVAVFAAVGLLDSNTVSCFYPEFKSKEKAVLMALPTAIGGVASFVFAVFPNTRHGIGYPVPTSETSSATSTGTSTA